LLGALGRRPVPSAGALRNATDRQRRVSAGVIFVALAIAGLPGLAGFAGTTLTLFGILRGHPAVGTATGFTFAALVGCLLIAAAYAAMLQNTLAPRRDEATRHSACDSNYAASDLTTPELASLLPAISLIVAIGVWPGFFLERTEPAASRLLTAYGTAFTGKAESASDQTRPDATPSMVNLAAAAATRAEDR
jgi:NADH:ubiquinone oxidoreductase subunit 4 (subunit M)